MPRRIVALRNQRAAQPCVVREELFPDLQVVDLFSGAGGIAEGFRQAGFVVIGGSDMDPDATATFALNFPEAEVITGDIRAPDVYERVIDLAREADVIVGGPPCQAFSQVRNHARLIDDPRNSLYREFVQVVDEARPMAFVMENVTGIDQMGVREQITGDLSIAGEYHVVPQVVDAANFGVPQSRKRLLFVGLHRSLRCHPPRLQGTDATAAVELIRRVGRRLVKYEVVVQENVLCQRVGDALSDPQDLSIVTASQAISDLIPLSAGRRNDEISYDLLPPPQSAYQVMMQIGRAHV